MVQCQHEHLLLRDRWERVICLFGYEPQQAGTPQWAMSQIKGALCLGTSELSHLPLTFGASHVRQVDDWHGKGERWFDDLDWASLAGVYGRAQYFVPLCHCVQAAFQCRNRERAREAKGYWDMVRGATRSQLIQEPKALLSKGEWQIAWPLQRYKNINIRRWCSVQEVLKMVRKLRNGWSFKEATQRQIHLKRLTDMGHYLHCEQRMPAKLEEMVPDTDLGQMQDLSPDQGQLLLQGRLGRDHLCADIQLTTVGKR